MTDERLEPISREEMVERFGEPGVANPNVIDNIVPESEAIVLVMIENRPWGSMTQLRELEEKINRYLGYALDGYLAQHYPRWAGRAVKIRLECREEPRGDAAELVAAARETMEAEGVSFEVRALS